MAGVSLTTVIVAYDSVTELRQTLPPLLTELEPGDELIVVDNASSDGLAAELEQLAPAATLIALSENVGFAAGANVGAAAATGELLVLLNPDARPQPGWGKAIRAPWGGRFSAWMGLVLLDGGTEVNTSGGVLHFTGFGWAGQVGRPVAEAPDAPAEVGFLSGACLAIPRTDWERLSGFPEHFFMYCEDVDLSLRLRLRGDTLAVIPDARVEHVYEFAKGPRKWRSLERNRWATILRTYPTPLLALVAPALIAAELAVWAMAARDGWARSKLLATLDLVRELPRLVRERRAIQAVAQVSAAEFATGLTADLSSPYFGAVGRQPAIRRALALYWRAVLAVLRMI
jgi:N-acetylglucosaminyl-diphospho-decaprenol L-rhamnosyltransferase